MNDGHLVGGQCRWRPQTCDHRWPCIRLGMAAINPRNSMM
jgi:hypothetical protein